MKKYLSLTSIDACDPLTPLGAKVVKVTTPDTSKQDAMLSFERGDHTSYHAGGVCYEA